LVWTTISGFRFAMIELVLWGAILELDLHPQISPSSIFSGPSASPWPSPARALST
jgi:hypothetical protein